MGAIASQITSLTIVFATVYSFAGQRKHQSSVSLAAVWTSEFPAQMASNAENVSMIKSYFRVNDTVKSHMGAKMIGKIWVMYKDKNKNKTTEMIGKIWVMYKDKNKNKTAKMIDKIWVMYRDKNKNKTSIANSSPLYQTYTLYTIVV